MEASGLGIFDQIVSETRDHFPSDTPPPHPEYNIYLHKFNLIVAGGEIQALPYQGRFNTYDGDAYAVSIGPNKKVSKKILKDLRDKFWVDRYVHFYFIFHNTVHVFVSS